MSATKNPVMRISGQFLDPLDLTGPNTLESILFLRTVSVKFYPIRSASRNSMTAAIKHAFLSDSNPTPTDVAKALATSFAPIPHAIRNSRIPLRMMIH